MKCKDMTMIKTKPKANSRRPATSVISCKVCVTILVVFSNTDYDSSFYRDKQYLFFCLFSMSGDQVDQTDHDHTRARGMRKVGGNTVIAAQADKDNSLMCYLMHFDLISSRIQSRIQSVFQPYFGQVQGSLRAHFLLRKRLFTYKHTRLLGLCSTRGGGGWCVFHSLTRRSVNLDYSNFGQDVLWEKMNILRQKVWIKLIMASL